MSGMESAKMHPFAVPSGVGEPEQARRGLDNQLHPERLRAVRGIALGEHDGDNFDLQHDPLGLDRVVPLQDPVLGDGGVPLPDGIVQRSGLQVLVPVEQRVVQVDGRADKLHEERVQEPELREDQGLGEQLLPPHPPHPQARNALLHPHQLLRLLLHLLLQQRQLPLHHLLLLFISQLNPSLQLR